MDNPILITADADQELINTVAIWESFSGKTLVKGQPDYLICANLAYQKYLLLQRVNSAFCNMLIDFATAPVIDYIVALLGVIRSPSQAAICTLNFTLVPGHGDLTISSGTRISSSDGLAIFELDQDITVASDVDTVTGLATCQSDGVIGNGYVIGSVNTIMDVEPYISTCSNIDITSGGSDAETDDELRIRAKMAPSSFSSTGSRDAYIYFAKSVSSLITDVEVITAREDPSVAEGEIDIYPLLKNGIASDNELNAKILAVLSDEKIRPLTDTVYVYSPTRVIFYVIINITKLGTSAIPSSDIVDSVTSIIENYKTSKYSKLGLDIIASEIESLCRIPGVYDLTVSITPPSGRDLTGRNLVISSSEFAYLNNYSISITGSNNG